MQRKSTSMMQYHLRAIRNAMEPSLGNFDAWYLKYMGKVNQSAAQREIPFALLKQRGSC